MQNNLFDINSYDGIVLPNTQKMVWEYLRNQEWHMWWNPVKIESKLTKFVPARNNTWLNSQVPTQSVAFHRCCFGCNEQDLNRHPIIKKLWEEINSGLGNQYEINGNPEDMFDTALNNKEWRVYANGSVSNLMPGTWGPHRDTVDMNDDSTVTILYCANLEWYPRWGGEFIFFPEDPDGLTGDHQQFNGQWQQNRGFNVGWADQGKMISPVPNRVIVYDGRALHNCKAPAGMQPHEIQQWRVVFRARRKTQ